MYVKRRLIYICARVCVFVVVVCVGWGGGGGCGVV